MSVQCDFFVLSKLRTNFGIYVSIQKHVCHILVSKTASLYFVLLIAYKAGQKPP